MTHAERKLRKAGFSRHIDDGRIVIKGIHEVEVYVTDSDGDHNYTGTKVLANAVSRVLEWGGFSCAWGGWVLQKGYQPSRQWNTR